VTVEQEILKLKNNQTQIVSMVKKLLTANNNNAAAIKELEKRVTAGEQLDQKQQTVLDGLKKVGKDIEDAEKVVPAAEVITQ